MKPSLANEAATYEPPRCASAHAPGTAKWKISAPVCSVYPVDVTMTASVFDEVEYPESDGQPMAEGDEQGHVIRTLFGGYADLFRDDADVHVSGDLFWYPVQGNPRVCAAPDVMVIDGCLRDQNLKAYLPWQHGGLPPRLVVEVLSPSNTVVEMLDKQGFYERHGVTEYVFIDPFAFAIRAWVRSGDQFVTQLVTGPWVSPTTGVTYQFIGEEFVATGPDGRRWLRPEQEIARANSEAARAVAAETEVARLRAEIERLRQP